MSTIASGPHYELHSSELAAWLEQQGVDIWWNVDGDPLLTGRLDFPCPADELAAELRTINRPLLVQAPKGDASARGQSIKASELGALATRFLGNLHAAGPLPEWANDRFFYLCWKGSPHEWLLAEDGVTTKEYRDEAAAKAT